MAVAALVVLVVAAQVQVVLELRVKQTLAEAPAEVVVLEVVTDVGVVDEEEGVGVVVLEVATPTIALPCLASLVVAHGRT